MIEEIIMLAGKCGHHFDKECQSCQNAFEVTNTEIEKLHAQIRVQGAVIEFMTHSLARISELTIRDNHHDFTASGVNKIELIRARNIASHTLNNLTKDVICQKKN